MKTNSRPSRLAAIVKPFQAAACLAVTLAVATSLMLQRALVERPAKGLEELRAQGLHTDDSELGNVITDNLGMIIFGIIAISAIGLGISGLGTKVIDSITKTMGL